MPRRNVEFRADEYYHVYNRGINKEPIFFERDNYLFFLRQIRNHLTAEICDVVAYCLMPNHYHLLFKLRQDNFSDGMKTFGISYSKSINKRMTRVGPLFQGPFQAIHVSNEAYLLHLTRYIHLNPTAAGLVAMPEDWEFSSYCDFIGLRDGSLPQSEIVMSCFGVVDDYRRFVESGMGACDTVISDLMFDE